MHWIIYAMCCSVTLYCLLMRVRDYNEEIEHILQRQVYIRIYPFLANIVVYFVVAVLSALFPLVWISYLTWKIRKCLKK